MASNNSTAAAAAAAGAAGYLGATGPHVVQERGNALEIISFIFFGIMTLIVACRVYARQIYLRTAGSDDYIILIAWALATAQTFVIIFGVLPNGGKNHIWDFPITAASRSRLFSYVTSWLFFWPASMAKLSIIMYYMRVSKTMRFQRTPKAAVRFTIFVAILTVVYIVGCSIYLLVQCRPLHKYWSENLADTEKYCVDQTKFPLVSGIFNLVLDFAVLLVSVLFSFYLNLPASQRYLLTLLLTAGGLTCVVGIFRVYYVDYVVRKSQDPTWDAYIVYILSITEVDVSVICASLPACKTLLEAWFNKTLNARKHSLASHGQS